MGCPLMPGLEQVLPPTLLSPFTGRMGEAVGWSGVETPAWSWPLWLLGWNNSKGVVNKLGLYFLRLRSEKCRQSTYWIPWKLTHNNPDPLVSSSAPLPNKMNCLAPTCVWKIEFNQTSEQVDRGWYLDPRISLSLLSFLICEMGIKKCWSQKAFVELLEHHTVPSKRSVLWLLLQSGNHFVPLTHTTAPSLKGFSPHLIHLLHLFALHTVKVVVALSEIFGNIHVKESCVSTVFVVC